MGSSVVWLMDKKKVKKEMFHYYLLKREVNNLTSYKDRMI